MILSWIAFQEAHQIQVINRDDQVWELVSLVPFVGIRKRDNVSQVRHRPFSM